MKNLKQFLTIFSVIVSHCLLFLVLSECYRRFLPACFCDAAEPWAYSFQETASPIAEGIVDFHDHLFYFLILILVAVTWIMTLIVLDSLKKTYSGSPFTSFGNYAELLASDNRVAKASLKDLNHGSVIEIVWTLTPAFILVLIAFPSFRLLYLMDEIVEPLITVKAVGFLY
jgi:cytochrome c oxidase subunit 2